MKYPTSNSTHRELWFFALLIALANLPLLAGRVSETLLFVPSLVAEGAWWRVLTSSFAHVSAYHLTLDAGAFLLLYHGLREPSCAKRLLAVAACAAGSLLASLSVLTPDGSLCGLSGVAHGLLAFSALEMRESSDRTVARAGLICLLTVLAKSAYEAVTGHVAFATLHLGDVATPVAICHAGGVLGGLFAYALSRLALFGGLPTGGDPRLTDGTLCDMGDSPRPFKGNLPVPQSGRGQLDTRTGICLSCNEVM